ncbi:MAG: ribonuclease III [Proteobacteria bacterium]|nr:ribonuclease III [Pseudomonadota bacterium]
MPGKPPGPKRPAGLADLETRLGYRFSDPDFLVQALTHSSRANEAGCGTPDNERMEFLGDAVLGLAVGRMLYDSGEAVNEGDLSRMRAAMVSEPGLAAMARSVGLGPHIRLGRGEDQARGWEKDSILADCMEAVIAAVYLDTGFPAARKVITDLFVPLMTRAQKAPLAHDFKTRLQEHAQSGLKVTPSYKLISSAGPDHDKTFIMEVRLGKALTAVGEGKSKKAAQQKAAENALLLLSEKKAPAAKAANNPPQSRKVHQSP